jgi:phosphoribosylformimino-5-aminoimidazole carboxamide ribotide isomerase
MRILPVLDLQNGHVVRAIAGQRHSYRPIRSLLTTSSEPMQVAEAFRQQFGLDELYVADLDAIGGAAPRFALFAALRDHGFQLWVDAGVRSPIDAELLLQAGVERVILGLETVSGPALIAELCGRWGRDRFVFSLDLKAGKLMGDWGTDDPMAIAAAAIDAGVNRLIVLDLARVGTGTGIGTASLMHKLLTAHPGVEVAVGGGVSGVEDLLQVKRAGVSAVLIASALHDGRLTRADLTACSCGPCE